MFNISFIGNIFIVLSSLKVAGGEMWKTTNFWPPEITSGTLLFPIMSRYNKRVESINHLDDNLRSPIAPMPVRLCSLQWVVYYNSRPLQ